MNAYSFDLHIKTNRTNNSSLSIELQYTMVDCLSYFMECLSSYFLLDLHLQKRFSCMIFSCISNITTPKECI